MGRKYQRNIKLFWSRKTGKIHNLWKVNMNASKGPYGYLDASNWQYYGDQHEWGKPLYQIMMDYSYTKLVFMMLLHQNVFEILYYSSYRSLYIHKINNNVRGLEMSQTQREWSLPQLRLSKFEKRRKLRYMKIEELSFFVYYRSCRRLLKKKCYSNALCFYLWEIFIEIVPWISIYN